MFTDTTPIRSKQQRFCEEFMLDLNATQAALRAGYSPRTAGQIGHPLLNKTSIQAEIRHRAAARSQRTKITAEQVVRELALIAFSDIREAFDDHGRLLPLQEIPEGARRAICSLDSVETTGAVRRWSFRIRLCDKLRALELLGKHLPMFTEVHEHRGLDGIEKRINEGWRRARGKAKGETDGVSR